VPQAASVTRWHSSSPAGWRLGILDISQQALDLTRSELQASGAPLVSSYCGSVASDPFVSASVVDFSAQHGGLDIIINNAGVGVAGAVDATPPEDWRWIVDINLLGAIWGCRAALPIMRRERAGVILNIASAAGFAAAPNMAAYNVTKAGVISLSETLAGGVSNTGIQVSCAMPGFFRSNLLDTLRAPGGERAVARRLLEHSQHDATEAAHAILSGAADRRLYIVWPREVWLFWRLKRLSPPLFLSQTRKVARAQFAG
jgi:NAD(P)-dependent dehydrogenase (short-subunit alcohol dehydrogenase family)